jgi:hypothetical protein
MGAEVGNSRKYSEESLGSGITVAQDSDGS